MMIRRGLAIPAAAPPEFAAMMESVTFRCVSSASFALAMESRDLRGFHPLSDDFGDAHRVGVTENRLSRLGRDGCSLLRSCRRISAAGSGVGVGRTTGGRRRRL